LIVTPRAWHIEPDRWPRNYFFAVFNEWEEIQDMWRTTKDFTLTSKMLVYRIFPSLTFRMYLADFQMKSKEKRLQMMKKITSKVPFFKFKSRKKKSHETKNVDRVGGDVFKPEVLRNPFAANKQMAIEKLGNNPYPFHVGEYQQEYFRKIVELLKQKGVEVYYISSPASKEVYEVLHTTQYFSDTDTFIQELSQKTPSFEYIRDELPKVMDDKYFHDIRHLNAEGSDLYAHQFRSWLDSLK